LIGTLATFGLGLAVFGLLRTADSRKESNAKSDLFFRHAHVHEQSLVERLPPECKIAAAALFVLAVVATPRTSFWAFGCHALVLAVVARAAKIQAQLIFRRLTIELPFVAFALFLPFLAGGGSVDVLGLPLSTEGLWAAWNILAKGTLGVATSIVLAASASVPEVLHGLERLRLPKALTAIAGFMVRYFDLLADDVRRMRIARESRGYDPRWLWQGKALASSAGTLFIRSYERGERVHSAMLSRGFQGTMPPIHEQSATFRQWAAALSIPATGATLAAAAWLAIL
jgi:cobalt/nickel transport system permease protein